MHHASHKFVHAQSSTWLHIEMGKPKTTNSKANRSKNAKSNPFAVKKSVKKAKKKIKQSLELVDKTFGDLQGQVYKVSSTTVKEPTDKRAAQEIKGTNKVERTAKATVDQLVKNTAQAKI